MKRITTAALLVLSAAPLLASTDTPDAIVTSASTIWGTVATLCVTIGTFIVGYRLARKVR